MPRPASHGRSLLLHRLAKGSLPLLPLSPCLSPLRTHALIISFSSPLPASQLLSLPAPIPTLSSLSPLPPSSLSSPLPPGSSPLSLSFPRGPVPPLRLMLPSHRLTSISPVPTIDPLLTSLPRLPPRFSTCRSLSPPNDGKLRVCRFSSPLLSPRHLSSPSLSPSSPLAYLSFLRPAAPSRLSPFHRFVCSPLYLRSFLCSLRPRSHPAVSPHSPPPTSLLSPLSPSHPPSISSPSHSICIHDHTPSRSPRPSPPPTHFPLPSLDLSRLRPLGGLSSLSALSPRLPHPPSLSLPFTSALSSSLLSPLPPHYSPLSSAFGSTLPTLSLSASQPPWSSLPPPNPPLSRSLPLPLPLLSLPSSRSPPSPLLSRASLPLPPFLSSSSLSPSRFSPLPPHPAPSSPSPPLPLPLFPDPPPLRALSPPSSRHLPLPSTHLSALPHSISSPTPVPTLLAALALAAHLHPSLMRILSPPLHHLPRSLSLPPCTSLPLLSVPPAPLPSPPPAPLPPLLFLSSLSAPFVSSSLHLLPLATLPPPLSPALPSPPLLLLSSPFSPVGSPPSASLYGLAYQLPLSSLLPSPPHALSSLFTPRHPPSPLSSPRATSPLLSPAPYLTIPLPSLPFSALGHPSGLSSSPLHLRTRVPVPLNPLLSPLSHAPLPAPLSLAPTTSHSSPTPSRRPPSIPFCRPPLSPSPLPSALGPLPCPHLPAAPPAPPSSSPAAPPFLSRTLPSSSQGFALLLLSPSSLAHPPLLSRPLANRSLLSLCSSRALHPSFSSPSSCSTLFAIACPSRVYEPPPTMLQPPTLLLSPPTLSLSPSTRPHLPPPSHSPPLSRASQPFLRSLALIYASHPPQPLHRSLPLPTQRNDVGRELSAYRRPLFPLTLTNWPVSATIRPPCPINRSK
ncbi:hypothetical protein C7M84_021168 [Penaeus vannamei]|uniref:Uncharacterized protein n=1 Tax=Penaeus vannamei TaxID=6689 RepID=A0A3R7T171_PENVA|nr:hypothetical protein C7M84_021168 [Penaeus vannamei]